MRDNPKLQSMVELARVESQIAQLVYDIRVESNLTQK